MFFFVCTQIEIHLYIFTYQKTLIFKKAILWNNRTRKVPVDDKKCRTSFDFKNVCSSM